MSKPTIPPDHLAGNFQWAIEPTCGCGQLFEAVKERFVFVSNFTDGDAAAKHSVLYMMPVDVEGNLVKSSGVQVAYCPWCGDKVTGLKRFQPEG